MFEGLVEQVEVVEVVDSIFLCKRVVLRLKK